MLNHDRVWANRLNERTTPSDGIEQAGWTHAPTARTSTFLFPITSVLITGFVIFLKPTAFVLAAIFNQQLGASRDLHRLKYPKRTFSEYHLTKPTIKVIRFIMLNKCIKYIFSIFISPLKNLKSWHFIKLLQINKNQAKIPLYWVSESSRKFWDLFVCFCVWVVFFVCFFLRTFRYMYLQ